MTWHPPSGSLFYFLMIFILMGCKGTSGGEGKQKETNKESWHMTDEPAQALIVPAEEETFRLAAHDGELEKVKALFKQGVASNVADQDGQTALMFAAFNGHSEIVLYLLNAGAEVDQRNNLDQTALLYASTGPFPETVKILLDRGADPNRVDSNEHFSPLMHAAAEGHLEVVKILISYGADRSLLDADGDDAASFAAQSGHMQVVEYLKMTQD